MFRQLVVVCGGICVIACVVVHMNDFVGSGVVHVAVPAPEVAVHNETPVPSTPTSVGKMVNIGVLEGGKCWKEVREVPEKVRRLQGSYYNSYVEFARRWTALPFCPKKTPKKEVSWARGGEMYVGDGGFAAPGNTTVRPVVVICATIAANEEFFVREWAVYHLLLGVARINIYPINKEQRGKLETALKGLEHHVWVEPTESEVSEAWMAAGGNHVSFEKRTIARCFKDRLNNSDTVLHIDLDEYLFPGLYRTIPELLSAELREKDELSLCVRYLGYGPEPPTTGFPPGTLYLGETKYSGGFCSNSKTAALSRCVKKPAVKVRSHFVHTMPMCCGCKSDPLVGTFMKKVAPNPCCRPSYFVGHMQHRDYALDSHRRRREVAPNSTQSLQTFTDWHTMTAIPDTRLRPYAAAIRQAIDLRCFESSAPCAVAVPDPVQPL